jgi:hypothetical protein
MTEHPTDNKQLTVSATFLATLVPTNIELGIPVETPSPPLVEPDSAEAFEEISASLSLPERDESLADSVEQDESLADAKDEIDELVRDIGGSTAKTLELSKRLDDLLARPIRWFRR